MILPPPDDVQKKFDDYDLIVALAVRRALVIALVHNPTLSAHAGRQGYFLFSSLEQSSIGVIAEQGIDYAADDSGDVRRNESEDERFVSFHGHYIVIIGKSTVGFVLMCDYVFYLCIYLSVIRWGCSPPF